MANYILHYLEGGKIVRKRGKPEKIFTAENGGGDFRGKINVSRPGPARFAISGARGPLFLGKDWDCCMAG